MPEAKTMSAVMPRGDLNQYVVMKLNYIDFFEQLTKIYLIKLKFSVPLKQIIKHTRSTLFNP